MPKEHMAALWQIVAKRGEKKKKKGGSEYQVGLEKAKFIEFENGTHSEFGQFVSQRLIYIVLDDTCVQEGYWTAVGEFIAKLGD